VAFLGTDFCDEFFDKEILDVNDIHIERIYNI